MKKEYLKYLWGLVVQDFLGCTTSEQLEAFKKEWPKFNMESTKNKSYSALENEVGLLIGFMKGNGLGYFKEQSQK